MKVRFEALSKPVDGSFVRTRLFHNSSTDFLRKELRKLEAVFNSVPLQPRQAITNRRIAQAIYHELEIRAEVKYQAEKAEAHLS